MTDHKKETSIVTWAANLDWIKEGHQTCWCVGIQQ